MTWKNTLLLLVVVVAIHFLVLFWSWFMVHVAPPPLGPTSGPPLVHLVAPPWSITWLPLPLIPLWIGRSSVGVQAERSEPQPTKRTTSNLTPIAVGTAHGMCMQWLNTPSWGSAPLPNLQDKSDPPVHSQRPPIPGVRNLEPRAV